MTEIISTISNLSIVQLLVVGLVVVFLQKSGIDVIGFVQSLLKKNGKGNGHKEEHRNFDEEIAELKEHAKVANNEMGEVKESLVALNTKMDVVMRHLKI